MKVGHLQPQAGTQQPELPHGTGGALHPGLDVVALKHPESSCQGHAEPRMCRGYGEAVAAPKCAFAFGFRGKYWGRGQLPPSSWSQRHLALELLEIQMQVAEIGIAKC